MVQFLILTHYLQMYICPSHGARKRKGGDDTCWPMVNTWTKYAQSQWSFHVPELAVREGGRLKLRLSLYTG